MEDEKKQLSERVAAIDTEIQGMPVFKELKDATVKRNETDEQIVSLSEYQRSLGMFKGKEKKALQAQIDELKAKRADYVELMSKLEETAKSARKPLMRELPHKEEFLRLKRNSKKKEGRFPEQQVSLQFRMQWLTASLPLLLIFCLNTLNPFFRHRMQLKNLNLRHAI